MKIKGGILLLFVCLAMSAQEIPATIQADIRFRLEQHRYLLNGGGTVFDDYALVVAAAPLKSGKEMLARSLAQASARSELLSLLSLVRAVERPKDMPVSGSDQIKLEKRTVKEITALIENAKQTGVRNAGEWVSADGKTLFVCMVRYFTDVPVTAKGGALPPGIDNWEVDENWDDTLRGASGLLKGGAGMVCDEYGEKYIIAVASCPASLPVSQQNIALSLPAYTAILKYSQGAMIDDMRYVRITFAPEKTENAEEAAEAEAEAADENVVVSHVQSQITQGTIRGVRSIGRWKIDNGRRVCGAYIVRVSDLTTDSYEIALGRADEKTGERSDDEEEEVIEVDVDEKTASLLKQELKNAAVEETENERIILLPENSRLFGKGEREILLCDPVKEITVNNININVNVDIDVNIVDAPTNITQIYAPGVSRTRGHYWRSPSHPGRRYLPVRRSLRPRHRGRHYRPNTFVQPRTWKRTVIRRGPPSWGPRSHFGKRPPTFRMRKPKPGFRARPVLRGHRGHRGGRPPRRHHGELQLYKFRMDQNMICLFEPADKERYRVFYQKLTSCCSSKLPDYQK